MGWKDWSGRKKLAVVGIALATLYGSCTHHEESIPPLYTHKVGTSAGILVTGFNIEAPESSFYGGVISFLGINRGETTGIYAPLLVSHESNEGESNGLEISLIQTAYDPLKEKFGFGYPKYSSSKNGLSIGAVTLANSLNGGQAGLVNVAGETNGFQIGLYNSNEGGKNIQLGLVNKVELGGDKDRWSIGINYSWN